MARSLTAVAIIAAHNEADIIASVIGQLVDQLRKFPLSVMPGLSRERRNRELREPLDNDNFLSMNHSHEIVSSLVNG